MSTKMLSLFSGIGAFEKALKNLGIEVDLVAYCDIDKYASKSYAAIHGVSEDMNLWDITKVDEKALPKDIDLITYGFPCQDISIAGRQKGLINEDGSQTRSGLFFEALRIIEETKPRVAIAENVKNLVGKKFNAQFQVVLASLEAAGYNNYWKVLNAKDYGVPQNRERVFIVSIRKDIDTGRFRFPEPIALDKRLKDVLDEWVPEKYYLSDKMTAYVLEQVDGCGFGGEVDPDVAHSLTATMTKMHRAGVDNYVAVEPICLNSKGGRGGVPGLQPSLQDRVYDGNGISTAVTTCFMPKVAVDRFVNGDVCKTVRASGHGSVDRHSWDMVEHGMRIRKLTPLECFRLMGFDDYAFHKAEMVNSDTQLYKQAGNSIVVDVLEAIFEQMFSISGKICV